MSSICIQSESERESLSGSYYISLQPVPGNTGVWHNEYHHVHEFSVIVFHWEGGRCLPSATLARTIWTLKIEEKNKEQASLLFFIGNLVTFLKHKSWTPLGYTERDVTLVLLSLLHCFLASTHLFLNTYIRLRATVPALQTFSSCMNSLNLPLSQIF